jgi:cellulose synthase/poly-beta-1,6-N-acetylglucosamine synthase-like glycosyltransferase
VLLFISTIGSLRQRWYSRVKKRAFLFKKDILPSITIIAPAYNEELSIIESVNSLLNIRYSDFEVVVVNDGSRDNTLLKLINYFELQKIDRFTQQIINTMPIRGVYANPSLPGLTVIDKVNGGKADSLNTGINYSTKEYFCGIDADSLLDNDALLRIVSSSIDANKEPVAVGGNIFPVNGCKVSQGVLESVGLPDNALANLQFIEYIRAFMAGRIGWSMVNCLLIISGAFGLFNKKRVIEIGGYLTSSSKYQKDTVGEDMELVVRLNRYMLEQKIPYTISYSYNANCWTEVPSKLDSLLKQRDRWHRGLVEILTLHRRLFFNKKYGRIGFVAMPYFLIFELIGPWLELQGYILVFLAALFSLLDPVTALLLFIATVMMGIFISTSSLVIAEQEINYFSKKDVLRLIGYAFLENFGFRQLISIWRTAGFLSVVKGKSGWGTIKRTGFTGGSH